MRLLELTQEGKKYEGMFASPKEYNSLYYVYNNYDNIPKNHREYVSKILTNFNTIYKKLQSIEDNEFRLYVKGLIKNQYYDKIRYLLDTIEDDKFVTHVANFISTKFKKLK